MTPELQAFITTIIAVYGAVIASLGLALSIVLAVLEIRRHQPNVRVTVSYGIIQDQLGNISEPFIVIEAVNAGNGAVVLETFGFLLNDGSKHVLMKPYLLQLPLSLAERRRCTAYYACRWFKENKSHDKIVAVFFKDETGNTWKANITRKMRTRFLRAPEAGYLIEWSPELQTYFPKDRAN